MLDRAGLVELRAGLPCWTSLSTWATCWASLLAWAGLPCWAPLLTWVSLFQYEDIMPSEWFSNLDDSFAGAGTQTVSSSSSESIKFRVSSPVSVLDNSSESSSSKRKEQADDTCRRDDASSKRPRQSFFIPPPPHLVSPTSSSDSENSENSENYGESCSPLPAEKKIKLSSNDAFNPRGGSRRCLHCEVTKTPQWRAGPLGPKTLCNACGVRYKSGRLYPEYRPAASPSFVSRLHSNSHKKVIEMRIKWVESSFHTE